MFRFGASYVRFSVERRFATTSAHGPRKFQRNIEQITTSNNIILPTIAIITGDCNYNDNICDVAIKIDDRQAMAWLVAWTISGFTLFQLEFVLILTKCLNIPFMGIFRSEMVSQHLQGKKKQKIAVRKFHAN